MSQSVFILAAHLMTLLPKVASATVYNFNATEMSALSPVPVSFVFSLDTSTAYVDSGVTMFNNIRIDENGTTSFGNTVGAQYGTDLGSPLFFLIDTGLQPFYLGSGPGITFNVGSFPIADGATDGEGTVNISAGNTSPVPEPATWTLLLTGSAAAGAARLKLLGRRHSHSEITVRAA